MKNYQRQFRTDIVSGIVDLVKSIWQPILAGYIFFFVFTKVFSLIFLRTIGFANAEEATAAYMDMATNQEALTDFMEDIVDTIIQPQIIVLLVVSLLAYFFILCWNYYYSFKISGKKVNEEAVELPEELKNSFDNRFLGSIGLQIIAFFITVGMITIPAFFAGMISPFLIFVLLPISFFFWLKLFLTYPAYVLSDRSIGESFTFSFNKMTFVRVLKLIAIGFAIIMGLAVVSLILQQIALLFKNISVVYFMVKNILDFIIGAASLTLIVACFTALYYRLADDLHPSEDDWNVEDHLVEDDF